MVIDKLESFNDITRDGARYVRIIGYNNDEVDKKIIVDISKDELIAALTNKDSQAKIITVLTDKDRQVDNKLYPAAVETLKTGPHAAFKFDILKEFNSDVLIADPWSWPEGQASETQELTVFIPSPEDWYPELGVDLVAYLADKINVTPGVKHKLMVDGYCIISGERGDKWTAGRLIDTFINVSDEDSANTRQIVIGSLHKLRDICKTQESYSKHILATFVEPHYSNKTHKNNLATRILEDFLFD